MAYDTEQMNLDVENLMQLPGWQDPAKRGDFIRDVAVTTRGQTDVETHGKLVDELWKRKDDRGLLGKTGDFVARGTEEVLKSIPASGVAVVQGASDVVGLTDTGSQTRITGGVHGLVDAAGQRLKQLGAGEIFGMNLLPGVSRQKQRDDSLNALKKDLDGGAHPAGLEDWLAGEFDTGKKKPDAETQQWIDALTRGFAQKAVAADHMGAVKPESVDNWLRTDRNPARVESDITGMARVYGQKPEAGPREYLADYLVTRDPQSWAAFVNRVTETDTQYRNRLSRMEAEAGTQDALKQQPEGLMKDLTQRGLDMQTSPIDLVSAVAPVLRGSKALQAAKAGGTLAAVGGRILKGGGKEALQEGTTEYLQDPRAKGAQVLEAAGLGAVGSVAVEGTMTGVGAAAGKLFRPNNENANEQVQNDQTTAAPAVGEAANPAARVGGAAAAPAGPQAIGGRPVLLTPQTAEEQAQVNRMGASTPEQRVVDGLPPEGAGPMSMAEIAGGTYTGQQGVPGAAEAASEGGVTGTGEGGLEGAQNAEESLTGAVQNAAPAASNVPPVNQGRAWMAEKILTSQGVQPDVAAVMGARLHEELDPNMDAETFRQRVLGDFEARGGVLPGSVANEYVEDAAAYEAQGYSPEEAVVHAANSRAANDAKRAQALAGNTRLQFAKSGALDFIDMATAKARLAVNNVMGRVDLGKISARAAGMIEQLTGRPAAGTKVNLRLESWRHAEKQHGTGTTAAREQSKHRDQTPLNAGDIDMVAGVVLDPDVVGLGLNADMMRRAAADAGFVPGKEDFSLINVKQVGDHFVVVTTLPNGNGVTNVRTVFKRKMRQGMRAEDVLQEILQDSASKANRALTQDEITRLLEKRQALDSAQGARQVQIKAVRDALKLVGEKLPGLMTGRVLVFKNAADFLTSGYARAESFSAAELEGMQGAEGFHDPLTGHTIVFVNQIEIREKETPVRAAARALLHERVGHDGVNTLMRSDAKFADRIGALAGQIPGEELSAIGEGPGYQHLAGDRIHLALEWLARKAATIEGARNAADIEGGLQGVAKQMWQAVKEWLARFFADFSRKAALAHEVHEIVTLAREAALNGTADPTSAEGLTGRVQFALSDRLAEAAESLRKMQQPAAASVNLGRAYAAAQVGTSSGFVPIAAVFQRARVENPQLTPEDFMAAVQAGDNAGAVYLEVPESAAAIAAAGPFMLRMASGVPATNMMVMPGALQFSMGGTRIRHAAGTPYRVNERAWRAILTGSALPRAFTEAVEMTERERKALDQRTAQVGLDLKTAVESYAERSGQPLADVYTMVNDALSGAPGTNAVLMQVDPVLHQRSLEARALLDTLSTAVAQTLPVGDLRNTIMLNQGAWMKRSYAAFDAASGWNFDSVMQAARDGRMLGGRDARAIVVAARVFLQAQNPNATAREIDSDMRDLMDREVIAGALSGTAAVRNNISSLLQRQDIPRELRELMGEEKNPIKRFLQSTSFQAQFIHRYQQQRTLRTIGLQGGLFQMVRGGPEGVFTEQIPTEDRQWSGLAGLWTTPQLWQAMQNVKGANTGTELWSHAGEALKALGNEAKLNRVAMNPDSWVVNALGNVVALVQTGDVFYFSIFRRVREAAALLRSGRAKPGAVAHNAAQAVQDAQRAMVARLTASGVLGQNFNLRDLEASIPRHLLAWVAWLV